MNLPEMECMEGRKSESPEARETGPLDEQQRSSLIRKMEIVKTKAARQCEHLKTNGEFCGSPALRGRNYCYFHLTYIGRRRRAERAHAAAMAQPGEAPVAALELPPLEDANSIQIALMQVIDAILHNRLDNKRAGLVLYGLQTASSNLSHGADFEQMPGATAAGRYEDFEQDFELGDDAPELKVEEADEEDVDHAKIAQIEELAAAYAKLDAAEAEADARRTPTEEDSQEWFRASYPCGNASQFLCSLNGPLARARAGGPEPPKRIQRDVRSQRLELVPRFRPKAGGKDAPPALEENEAAA